MGHRGTCPDCGFVNALSALPPLAELTNIGGRIPQPGDVTICWRCAAKLRYDEQMQLVELKPEDELSELVSYTLSVAAAGILARNTRGQA